MLRFIVPVLALSMLLLACAPSTLGSANRPIDLSSNSTVTVAPGESVYLRLIAPPERFRLGAEVFSGYFALPLGADGSVRSVTREFSLVDVRAPEGWNWQVDSVRLESRPSTPLQLVVILRLDVPRNTRLGGAPISADLLARASNVRERVSLAAQVLPNR
jgi:hypothetical protein